MRVMGYTPKHAKPASLKDAALSHGLTAINAPSIGRHAAPSAVANITVHVAAKEAGADAAAAPAKAA